MLFDLFLKYVVTPENVLGLIWSTVTTICMCLIFCAWQEKWWKSLIPFYGNYLIYKHTWKKFKWLFLVEIGFDTLAAKSTSFMKKHIVNNVFYTVKTYIKAAIGHRNQSRAVVYLHGVIARKCSNCICAKKSYLYENMHQFKHIKHIA